MARGKPRADGTVVEKGPDYGSALKAIRKHCKTCCDGSAMEIEKCPVNGCDLYPFRFGQGPDVARSRGRKVDPPKNPKERVL